MWGLAGKENIWDLLDVGIGETLMQGCSDVHIIGEFASFFMLHLMQLFSVGSPPFVTPQGTLQVGPTHRISSFPLSSFRLPRYSNPRPRVFSPMGSISGTN